jgi:hypothetical protein
MPEARPRASAEVRSVSVARRVSARRCNLLRQGTDDAPGARARGACCGSSTVSTRTRSCLLSASTNARRSRSWYTGAIAVGDWSATALTAAGVGVVSGVARSRGLAGAPIRFWLLRPVARASLADWSGNAQRRCEANAKSLKSGLNQGLPCESMPKLVAGTH